MNWTIIFRDAIPSLAGVTVYDKGQTDSLGRYVIAKVMKLKNHSRTTQSYRSQRPAAIRLAKKFLNARAEKAGRKYVAGDGTGTWAFKPILEGGVS